MICHTHATGGNRTTRDTDDDDDDEEDDEEEDDTRLRGHATPCARMRPARPLSDSPSAHQYQQQRGKKFASSQTSRSAESKCVHRLLISLFRVEEITPESSTTTEEISRRDWRTTRNLRVQRSSAECSTTTVRPRRRSPVALAFLEALAFPRRGAVVRSTGVG